MKILAVIGLLFCLYCLIQIVSRWEYRNGTEKTIWAIVIVGIGSWAVSVLLR